MILKNNLPSKRLLFPSFLGFLGTQFFGAFNDNLLRFGSVIFFLRWVENPQQQTAFISLSAAMFGAPFLLFSLQAGRLADRFSKRSVILWIKIAELVPVGLAGMGAYLQSSVLILTSLFFIATQSAFFGPAKYGVIPELITKEKLGLANAWLNLLTFTAILFGSALAGLLNGKAFPLVSVMVAASLLGLACSSFIHTPPPTQPNQTLKLNPFPDLIENWRAAMGVPGLISAFWISSFFWFAGAVTQINTLVFVEEVFESNQTISAAVLAISVAGISLGGFFASRILKGKVSLRLTPWGAFGMGLSLLGLGFLVQNPLHAVIGGFFMGFFSGLYIVPLNAFIQAQSPVNVRGRILGSVNLINFIGIISASVFLWVGGAWIGFSSAGIFSALGICCLFLGGLTIPLSRRLQQKAP